MFSLAKLVVLFTVATSVAALPSHLARHALNHREIAARVAHPEVAPRILPYEQDGRKRLARKKRARNGRCSGSSSLPSSTPMSSPLPSPTTQGDHRNNPDPTSTPADGNPDPASTPADNPDPSSTPADGNPYPVSTPASDPQPTSTPTDGNPDPASTPAYNPDPSTSPADNPEPSTPTPTPTPTPTSGSDGNNNNNGGGQMYTGQGTFYATGLGACGITNNDGQDIAAVSHMFFDAFPGYNGINPNTNPLCGKTARVTYQGTTIEVQLTDRCGGCQYGDLDFSPHAFNQLADPSQGRISNIEWEIID